MAVGDKVLYVPGVEYAKVRGPNGLSWVFGRRKASGSAEIVELSDKLADGLMSQIKRQPGQADLLVPLAPKAPWSATIVKEHEGTADLDVQYPAGGVTTHLNNVPHDPSGKAGTYFAENEDPKEEPKAAPHKPKK